MSISKPFLTVTSLAVAAMFGGGVYVMMNLGTFAEQITERVASKTLGVAVEIEGMDISLPERKVTISGLSVANPPGFDKAHAMTTEDISITLGNVSKTLITFKDIQVTGTEVNVEVKEQTTNLQTIKNNIKIVPPEPVENENGEEVVKEPLKVIIDQLALSGAKINPSVTLVSATDLAPVSVPNIVLNGIGQKENGVLVSEAVAQVWQQLSAKFSNAASGAGFYEGMSTEALREMGQTQLQGMKDKISNGLKGLFD